jgi:hypothetical protein
MNRSIRCLAPLALVVASVVAASAQQPANRVQTGTLNCDVSAGIGMIVGSRKEVQCLFTPAAANAPREVYVGAITKLGLDIGATSGGQMVWAVYAPTSGVIASLAGNYGGATAEATIGAGLGANVLVGGSNRTVALQPLSVQGQAGLNLAAGVAELQLRPAR